MGDDGDDYYWERSLTSWIHFRNSHNLGPVVVQSFMLLCAFLIILGLIYVLGLVIAITIHHLLYDRDAKKVPDYVKNSIQFSSSDSEDDKNNEDSENEDEENGEDKGSKYASTARKLANLDKFMSYDAQKSRTVGPQQDKEGG